MRVGWKPAEGVVQRDVGECTDLARAVLDETRHRRDRTITPPAPWTAFRRRVTRKFLQAFANWVETIRPQGQRI